MNLVSGTKSILETDGLCVVYTLSSIWKSGHSLGVEVKNISEETVSEWAARIPIKETEKLLKVIGRLSLTMLMRLLPFGEEILSQKKEIIKQNRGVYLNLQMDGRIAELYTSNTQKIRIITENWVGENMFCPYCGNQYLSHFENNRPVADFFCTHCKEEYELKSKGAPIHSKVNDGAYDAMIERINAVNHPNFFFMHYDRRSLKVKNFVMVPKYFFSVQMIEKRKPLAETARRAGWVGCNILLNQIPEEGRIFIVKEEEAVPPEQVKEKVERTDFMRRYELDARGWMLDILNCVNKMEDNVFTLEQMYGFADALALQHPDNHHIKDKIRQQLQVLRDNGIIEFVGRGRYCRLYK